MPAGVRLAELVRDTVSTGEQEKGCIACFLGDPRNFGIQADQTFAAQDEGE